MQAGDEHRDHQAVDGGAGLVGAVAAPKLLDGLHTRMQRGQRPSNTCSLALGAIAALVDGKACKLWPDEVPDMECLHSWGHVAKVMLTRKHQVLKVA